MYLKKLLLAIDRHAIHPIISFLWMRIKETHKIEREPARNNINELSIKAIDQFLLFFYRIWLCSVCIWTSENLMIVVLALPFSWLFFISIFPFFFESDRYDIDERKIFSLMTKWPNLLSSSIRAHVDEYLRSSWDNKTSNHWRRDRKWMWKIRHHY